METAGTVWRQWSLRTWCNSVTHWPSLTSDPSLATVTAVPTFQTAAPKYPQWAGKDFAAVQLCGQYGPCDSSRCWCKQAHCTTGHGCTVELLGPRFVRLCTLLLHVRPRCYVVVKAHHIAVATHWAQAHCPPAWLPITGSPKPSVAVHVYLRGLHGDPSPSSAFPKMLVSAWLCATVFGEYWYRSNSQNTLSSRIKRNKTSHVVGGYA